MTITHWNTFQIIRVSGSIQVSGDGPSLSFLRPKVGAGRVRVRPKGGEGRPVPRNLD